MKKGKWFWVAIDKDALWEEVEVYRKKPIKNGEVFSGRKIAELCINEFREATGIKIEHGECLKVRLEVKK